MNSLIKNARLYGLGGWNRIRNRGNEGSKEEAVIQMAALGDACLLISVCGEVSDSGRDFDVICRPGFAALWHYFLPDWNVTELSSDDWSPSAIQRSLNQCMNRIYKTVYVTSMVPFSAYVSSFLTAERRIGMIEKRSFKGARWILDSLHRVTQDEHIISRYRGMFGLPDDFNGNVENQGIGIDRSKKIQNILIHPGGKWELRRWPADRFKAVGALLQERGYSVRYLIHESEDDLLQHFKTSEFDGVGTLEVTRNIPDLLNAMERADFLIGNDSGPIHLAGLMDKPAVCIWGPGNYERIHPVGRFVKTIIHPVPCRPCRQYRRMTCSDGKRTCLDSITVEEVLEAVEGITGAATYREPNT